MIGAGLGYRLMLTNFIIFTDSGAFSSTSFFCHHFFLLKDKSHNEWAGSNINKFASVDATVRTIDPIGHHCGKAVQLLHVG